MSKNYGQLRICVEKHLNAHILNDINNVSNKFKRGALRAAFQKTKVWEQNSVINVYISEPESNDFKPKFTELSVLSQGGTIQYDPIENDIRTGNNGSPLSYKECVKLVVLNRIQPLVNLKFNFVDKREESNVRVAFKNDGAWAFIGTDNSKSDKSETTVNFGWIDAATIMHEFCHVLGLIHEHQNPNGKPIEWDKKVVYTWASDTQGWDKKTAYNNIIKHYEIDQINGTEFDPNSIMLYFFPAELTENHVGTHQNNIISKLDYEWIIQEYPGGDVNSYKGPMPWNSSGYNPTITIIIFVIVIILLLIGYFIFRKH